MPYLLLKIKFGMMVCVYGWSYDRVWMIMKHQKQLNVQIYVLHGG